MSEGTDLQDRAAAILAEDRGVRDANALERAQREQNEAVADNLIEVERDRLRKVAADTLAPKVANDAQMVRWLITGLRLMDKGISLRRAAKLAAGAAQRAGCEDVHYEPFTPPDGDDVRVLGFHNGVLLVPDSPIQLTAVREYFVALAPTE